MRPASHQLYPLAALVVLAAATVWLERVTRDERPVSDRATRTAPDMSAERTRLVSYDEHGRQRYELLAERVVSYPHSGTTELLRPRLRYLADGRTLSISADTGVVGARGTEVFLAGDVRVQRAAAGDAPAMHFASASLRVWPEREQAETHDPVELTQGRTVVRAQGLRADNLFGTLDLMGDVNVHMPRSPRPR